jgi:hypothetical protein
LAEEMKDECGEVDEEGMKMMEKEKVTSLTTPRRDIWR